MPAKKDSPDTLSFEDALHKLETLTEALEGGDIPLEQLVARYEEGTLLLQLCRKRLEDAELRIEKLREASPEAPLDPLDPAPQD